MALYANGKKVCPTINIGINSINLTSPNIQSDIPIPLTNNVAIWAGDKTQVDQGNWYPTLSGVSYYLCDELGGDSEIILSDAESDIISIGSTQVYYVGIGDRWEGWLTEDEWEALPSEDQQLYDRTEGYRPVLRYFYTFTHDNQGYHLTRGGTAKIACLSNQTLNDMPIMANGSNYDSVAISDGTPINENIEVFKSLQEINPNWIFFVNDVGVSKGEELLCPISGLGITREISSTGVYQMPVNTFTFKLPSNAINIGAYAMYYSFYDCASLTSVDLSSIIEISGRNALGYAFYNCESLTFVNLSNLTSVSSQSALERTFYNCTSLTSVDLSSLEAVSGFNAMYDSFDNCTSLTSVDLSSLTTVSGSYSMRATFYGTSILSINLPSLTTVSGSYTLYQAFSSCTSLTSADLSALSTVSGEDAMGSTFNNCTSLTSVDLSALTTVSGSYAMVNTFNYCSSLTSIDLSALTTVSGNYAMSNTFNNCTSLTSVSLPSLVTISGSSAANLMFGNCTSITSASFPLLTSVSGNYVMNGVLSYCTPLTSVDFSSLTTIGTNTALEDHSQFYQAFMSCNNLTSINFPSLEEIYCTGSTANRGTFYGNSKIQKMYFPRLTTITYGAGASSSYQVACKNIFYGCSSLTELHFGAANQAAIEASPGYSTAWGRGAGNVTIYFDL